VRYGSQQPTFEVLGPYDHSAGARLCAVYESWGTRFYPCQARELTLFMARDADGRFASRTICISKPRQNGKSFSARKYAITMGAKGKKVLYSAHNGKTTRKMFRHIADECEGTPRLARALRTVYRAAGTEGVYFANGGCIEFQTRTNSGGRGETYDVIIIDEAQELTYDQLDAIKPTTLASESGDPQMIYIGTPPNERCAGDVFRDYHDAAHSGKAGSMWWMEWASDGIVDLSDRAAALEAAYRTNPALGHRIREDVMLDAIDGYVMKPDSFAREYLGWWTPVHEQGRAIDAKAWDECETDAAPAGGRIGFGIRFSADGTRCAVASCTIAPGGVPHVELVRDANITATGIGWVTQMCARNAQAVALAAVDGQGNADALAEALRDADMPRGSWVRCGTRDAIAANAMLVNAVRERALTHLDDPALTESACGVARRPIGTGGGFGFEGDYCGPTEAAALALWAARTTRRDPSREGRIG